MLNKYRCLLLEDAMVKTLLPRIVVFFKTLQVTATNSERKKPQGITFSQHSLKGIDTTALGIWCTFHARSHLVSAVAFLAPNEETSALAKSFA